jgi:hypothetical protein
MTTVGKLGLRVAAAIGLLAAVSVASAQTPQPEPPELKFRRIYAPSNGILDWPRGNIRYLPVEAEEFERLVQAAGGLPVETATAMAARVDRAQYRARLDDDLLAAGQAKLEIVHSAGGPVLLPLAPCNLALTLEAHADQQQDAVLGTRADGRLALLVKRSEPLQLGWTLRGRRDATGAVEFDLELPRATDNRFELDLPAQTTPIASTGIVSPLDGGNANRRRWTVELGGEHRFSLRIAPSDPASQRRRLALVRTATTYEFSSRGIDVTSQWRLDAQHDTLRQLEVALDPGLQLVSAYYGETPVAWSASRSANEGAARLVLELPDVIRGPARVLRLTAMAPLRLDESTLLPRIQPHGVTWQEGTLSMMLPEPFQLQQLLTFSCRQSKIGPLPASLSGEALEFQCFGPEATAQVLVARQRDPLRISSGVDIGVASGEKTARWVGNFEVSSGERFHVLAEVPRHWVIESLATIPDDDLADWNVVEAEGSDRLLNVRLATAITPNHPVRMVITARGRSSPLVKRIGPSDVTIVKFRGAKARRELIGLRPIGPLQIQLDGDDEPVRMDPQQLSAGDRQLFADPPPELIIQRSPDSPRWWATAVPESPRYRAQIETRAEIVGGRLHHSWRLECTPDGVPLEKLLVYLTQAGRNPPKWSYAEDKLGRLVPRKLTAQQQAAAGLAASGEAWELHLNRLQSEPLEIRATRDEPWDAAAPVSLACAPLATSQQATLTVQAAGDVRLSITNARLDTQEPPRIGDGSSETVRAVYRYDPQREAAAETSPAVQLAVGSSSPPQAGAIVWNQRIEALLEPSGRGMYQGTWLIENNGRAGCQVRLGGVERIIGVWLDAKTLPVVSHGPVLDVRLPHGRRFSTLVIQYELQQDPWQFIGARDAAMPQIDLPVVDQTHVVWLPAGCSVVQGPAHRAAAHEPSWSRRLLGPLGRDAQQSPFDPAEVQQWSALVGMNQVAEQSTIALAFLRQLGQHARAAQTQTKAMSWGYLLGAVRPLPSSTGHAAVLVDRHALADQGIWPVSPVTLEAGSSSSQEDVARGLSMLQYADLALLVSPEALVLTTANIAAAQQAQLIPLGLASLYAAGPGALERQLRAGAVRESARFVHAAGWRAEIAPPWHSANRSGWHPDGWTAYRIEPQAGVPQQLILVRNTVIQAAAALAFFWAIVVGAWLPRRRPAWLLLLAGLCATAALLLPAETAPIASGGLLGALAALAWRVILPRRLSMSDDAAVRVPSGSTTAKLAGGVVLSLLLTVCVSRALGAEPSGSPESDASIFRVFIPSDEDGKPTGQRYLVPEDLYKAMRQRALEARGEPEGWLLRRAHYDATLQRAMGGNSLEVGQCMAQFEIEVLSPATRVRLALGQSGLAELPRQGLLDGQAIPLEWDAKAQVLECTIGEPGTYHLEVPLRPVVRTSVDWTGFEIGIAPHPLSDMTLRLPPDPVEPQLPVTTGPVTRSDDGRTLHAALGPGDQWVVHWPQPLSGRSGPAFDVEELMWLKVRPGSVLLEVKAQLTVQGGQLNRLQVMADPRLRLLPLSGSQWRLVESRVLTEQELGVGEPRELHFQPATPLSDQGTWHATFLLTGTSAFGHLRLPRLEVLGGRSTRRWLAVNVDPALEFEAQDAQQAQALTPTNFTTHWGPSSTAPQLACELPPGETNWTLATHPRQPRTTAHQRLALCVGAGSVDVRYDAQLLTTDGYTFQHRLLAPVDLQVESVSVLEDGVQRAAHWGRDRTGVITVLLTAPVTGAQQLTLEGSLTCPAVGHLALPLVRFEESSFKDMPILLYRWPSVLASLDHSAGLTETAERVEPEAGYWPRARLAAALVASNESPSAELRIAPNAARAAVVQLISLAREGAGWQATGDSVWTVSDGVLDSLRFEIPANWNGPFTINPPADYEVLSLPQQKVKHLIVRPHSSIRDKYHLTITGPLTVATGEPVSMADVRPLGVEASRRLVRLPRQVGLQHVIWETSDLRPAELPAGLLPAAPLTEAADILQAAGPTSQVRLKAVDRVTAVPQVKLADIQVRWQADGRFDGLACFDLEPARGGRCRFDVPGQCQLLRVTVDGLTATPLPAGDGKWDVPIIVSHLPQRIEVLFDGRHVQAGWNRIEMQVPMPQGIAVEKTLWTVAGPDAGGAGEILGGKSTGALRAELVRLQSASTLSNLPMDAVSGSGGDELKSWYQVWYGHWNAARRSARRLLMEVPHNSQTVTLEAEIKAFEREQTAIAHRLTAAEGPVSAGSHEPPELWSQSLVGGRPPTRSIFEGAVATATIRYPHPESAVWWTRLAIVAAAFSAAFVLWLAAWRGLAVGDWLRRWPHPLAMVLSLAWWLWLSPSAWGLLAAAVTLLLSLRCALRRAHDAPASVLRLGTTR